jgi:hypothetical protein
MYESNHFIEVFQDLKFKGFETTNELTWSFFSLVKRNLIYIK